MLQHQVPNRRRGVQRGLPLAIQQVDNGIVFQQQNDSLQVETGSSHMQGAIPALVLQVDGV